MTNDCPKLRENLRIQLDEVEMLQSMFPKEFRFEEGSSSELLQNYLEDETNEPATFIDFTINIMVHVKETQLKFEVCVTFPQDYPDVLPDIYLRNAEMNRIQSSKINKDCVDYLTELPRGEPCIYSAISWLQDNVARYDIDAKMEAETTTSTSEKVVRYWIYSHHIYNKTKRREILYLANRLNLTGFCMPGKPGIVCIEGNESECNQWWASIRSMTWQKIMCKVTEDVKNRRFVTFEEVAFQTHGSRNNHSDLGELYKFLEQHKLEFIFKELFGIDGGK